MRYKIFRALTVAGVLVLMATARGFGAEPDATVRIAGKSIAAGVGFSWGSGVLTYQGKEYPFSMTGLSAGDIGKHFPPSDVKWQGAPSRVFLEHARDLLRNASGAIVHCDVTLICERPKIGPHRDAMRERIAEILDIDIARVSVKATTTEGRGFAGRGEGLAAQAVVTVRLPS